MRAVVVGTVSMDLVATSADAPTACAAVGNSGANIAVRLADAGWDVELVALVGPDPIGAMIAADLHRWGVGTEGVAERPGYLSPRVFQVVDGSEGPSSLLLTCPVCGRPRGHLLEVPTPDELPEAVRGRAATCDLLLTDVATPLSIELAASAQGRVWFEASLGEATVPAMRALAAHADVLKVSADELDHYAPSFDVHRGLQIITEGAAGTRWRQHDGDGSSWHREASHLAQAPVDSIGAGDAFTAAAATALAGGSSPAVSVVAGSVSAAAACTVAGARGDMLVPPPGGSSWFDPSVPFRCGRCDLEQVA